MTILRKCFSLIVLWSMTSQPSYAQNTLGDFLKNAVNKAEQQVQQQHAGAPPPPNQQQTQTNQKDQATNLNSASEDHSATQAVGKDELGPDVIGFRIGMAPARVREMFKSRVLLSPELQKSYWERSETLAFYLPNGQLQPVPNAKYYSSFQYEHKEKTVGGLYHAVNVFFTAVPGHEELVSLHRLEWISPSKQPTYSAFLKALSEKYGAPTYSPPGHPDQLYWFYDKNGTLRKPGTVIINDADYLTCNYGSMVSGDGLRGSWTISLPKDPQFRLMASKCGAIVMMLGMEIENVTKLVASYSTNLIGIESAIRAYDTSHAIIDKASASANGARIKAGDQQKPDL